MLLLRLSPRVRRSMGCFWVWFLSCASWTARRTTLRLPVRWSRRLQCWAWYAGGGLPSRVCTCPSLRWGRLWRRGSRYAICWRFFLRRGCCFLTLPQLLAGAQVKSFAGLHLSPCWGPAHCSWRRLSLPLELHKSHSTHSCVSAQALAQRISEYLRLPSCSGVQVPMIAMLNSRPGNVSRAES